MKIKKDICLLLTGTIQPESVPDLARKNAIVREKDYVDAIEQWLTLDIPLVFCENSNFYSDALFNLLENTQTPTEYLTFKTEVSHLGKSHGEAEIINYALSHSKLLGKADLICKSTGRYYVRNGASILNKITYESLGAEVYCNLTRNLKWADSRFFIATPAFFKQELFKTTEFINEKNTIYYEHALACAVALSIFHTKTWQMLPEYPIYEGVYGTMDKAMTTGRISILKKKIFHQLKRFFFDTST